MFIPGSCDNGFLCSNIRIEANKASSDIRLKNCDFEIQGERHEEKRKVEEGVVKSA